MKTTLILLSVISIFCATGASAQWVNTHGTGEFTWSLAANGNTVIAKGRPVLCVTRDSGENWTYRDSGLSCSDVRCFTVSGPLFFAGSVGCGVFLSSDSGWSWSAVNNGLPNSAWIGKLGFENGVLYASLQQGGLFRSTNNGSSWLDISKDLANFTITSFASNSKFVFASAFRGGVFRSSDSGAHWTDINTGISKGNVRSIATCMGNLFAGTGDSGIYFSTNAGESWTKVNNGLSELGVNSFAIVDSNAFVATTKHIYVSKNLGSNWIDVSTGSPGGFVALAVGGNNLFGGSDAIYRRPLSEMIKPDIATIKEIDKAINLQIYPNPASDALNVRITSKRTEHHRISIVNSLGVDVLQLCDEVLGEGEHSFTWRPAYLNSGVYSVIVKSEAGILRRTVVVTH